MRSPRFTVRRMMVAVACTGFVFGYLAFLGNRRVRFRSLAKYHLEGQVEWLADEE